MPCIKGHPLNVSSKIFPGKVAEKLTDALRDLQSDNSRPAIQKDPLQKHHHSPFLFDRTELCYCISPDFDCPYIQSNNFHHSREQQEKGKIQQDFLVL